jgi:UDP-2,3-diacylglucosamine hydrolase
MEMKKVGLIAGNGHFPILFARAARQQGLEIIAAGVRGETLPFLSFFVDKLKWFKVSQLRDGLSFFKAQGVSHVIMAGQVSQRNLFDPAVQADQELKEFFSALQDRKADTIFGAVADFLDKAGLQVLESTLLLEQFLAPAGVLTRRGPTGTEVGDIEFGKVIAKNMGSLDVGQTVVIKEKAIVAIEAMEGTDRCILRGGRIARSGAVVVKTSKPDQDLRFDVPVIGPRTLKFMIRSRCQCLGIEAGKTLIIDKPACVALADKAAISIVSS